MMFRQPLWRPVASFAFGVICLMVVYLIGRYVAHVWQTPDDSLWAIVLGVIGFPIGILLVFALPASIQKIRHDLRRYEFTSEGLTLHGLIQKRFIAWSQIRDFVLPGSIFPNPPKRLILRLHHGQPIDIHLEIKPCDTLRKVLLAYVPGLAEHGLDQVHEPEDYRGPPIEPATRIKYAFGGYYAFITVLFCIAGALGYGFEAYSYHRIQQNPVPIKGKLLEAKPDKDIVQVKIEHQSPAGTYKTTRHRVSTGFQRHYKVGDSVAIEYARDWPALVRVARYD